MSLNELFSLQNLKILEHQVGRWPLPFAKPGFYHLGIQFTNTSQVLNEDTSLVSSWYFQTILY
jgi:hypothetical protein